jgi:uncharacterized membrane protein YqiK
MTEIIIIVVAVFVVFVTFLTLISLQRCPSDKILVIYGRKAAHQQNVYTVEVLYLARNSRLSIFRSKTPIY